MKPIAIRLTALGLLSSCATSPKPVAHQLTQAEIEARYVVGPWSNPYKGDPKLAGVFIEQLGECPYDQDQWIGKHPSMILFYFWDGGVRQQNYEPNGTIQSDHWSPQRLEQGDSGWGLVDFSYGSDPHFLRHRDPRLKPKT